MLMITICPTRLSFWAIDTDHDLQALSIYWIYNLQKHSHTQFGWDMVVKTHVNTSFSSLPVSYTGIGGYYI